MAEPLQNPFIHPNALVETDQIGDGTRIWAFAHVQQGVTLGTNCNVGDHAFIERGVTVGNNVTIKNGVCVWEHVEVADNVFLGPNVVLTNDLTPRSRATDWVPVKTHIGEGVSIGANATIVCGISLGQRALIGAGSVVTRDVRPFELVYGNPATHRGWVCFCGTPLPDKNPMSECPRCARKYQITEEGVEEIA
jgi:acetyltransferase-like isoleucine patch superfamily enzyme